MTQKDKTKEELIEEIDLLKKRIAEFETKSGARARMDAIREIALETIRNSEEKFRVIFDNANDGMLLTDVETKKIHAGNNAICRMLGYSPTEIKNLGVTDIHPKEAIPYIMGQFDRQAKKEIVVAKDLPVKRKDGSIFYADVNSSAIKLAGRTYLLGIFRDVTERRKVEDELREQKKIMEDISDGITDWVFLLSKDFKIIWANKAALKQTGYKIEEISGDYCYRVTHNRESPCQPPDDVCPAEEAMKTGKSVTATHTNVNTAGDKLFMEVTAFPIVNEKGEVVRFVHLTRDVTERMNLVEESEKRLHELEIFYTASVGREERILELKKEIERLGMESGRKQGEKA